MAGRADMVNAIRSELSTYFNYPLNAVIDSTQTNIIGTLAASSVSATVIEQGGTRPILLEMTRYISSGKQNVSVKVYTDGVFRNTLGDEGPTWHATDDLDILIEGLQTIQV